MVTEKNRELCTGCGVCAAICPKKCLSITLDENGFYKAVCDEVACVDCGLCDKVCPKFMESEEVVPLSLLSAVSKDKQTLSTTSSGGLCYELAKKAIADGKKVCACVYNYDKHRAEHIVVDNMDALEATKGSKYFQSYTPEAFSKIFDGNEWAVFGSPCQIAAIDAAAKRKKCRDKLLLVDFFCHGTPSMNLWKKYLAEQGGENVKKIDFRSKEFGWHTFSLRFTYGDGSTRSDFRENMFYTFFFGNHCLNRSCYSCGFKALKSAADIRVGDYWGEKYKDDREGVSCCVVFTQMGKRAVDGISDVCLLREELAEQMLVAQMVKSPSMPCSRKTVLRALRGKRSLKNINNTTLFLFRARYKIKSIMGSKK